MSDQLPFRPPTFTNFVPCKGTTRSPIMRPKTRYPRQRETSVKLTRSAGSAARKSGCSSTALPMEIGE